jgi:phospholipid/cholesterol/gamma-HCH transport system ATP-binding protein
MVDTVARPRDDQAAEDIILHASNLTVRFGGQTVLKDIDLKIPRGQTLVIIGESGCGKTVLLKTLIGLVRPTTGTMIFEGQDINKLGSVDLARERLRYGFVFQGAALFDSLDVFENIAFALREHRKMTDAQLRETVRQRLHEVGLSTEIAPKKPAELSGGMRKRVGLARAIAMDPEVMLYDEPTTGLDPIMSDVINELIIRTRKRGNVTSVVVTHDMKSALKVADRVVMLYPRSRLEPDESQVLYDGPPSEIEAAKDPRVTQFVQGQARDRLMELLAQD